MFNNKSIKILNCQQQFNKSFKLKHFMLSSGRWGLWVAEGRRKCSQQDPALCFQEELRAISRGDSGRIQDRPCVEGLDSLNGTYIEWMPCHSLHHTIKSYHDTYHVMSHTTNWLRFAMCILLAHSVTDEYHALARRTGRRLPWSSTASCPATQRMPWRSTLRTRRIHDM